MFVLRHWHDSNIYNREIVFTFSNCNMHKKMKLSALLTYLSDTAGEDYDQKGLSNDFLTENGYAFLISSYNVKFIRTPREAEFLTIRTWEQGLKGPKVLRDYKIVDEDGISVIEAKSIWCIVNPDNHKLIRPKKFPFSKFLENEEKVDMPYCEKNLHKDLVKVYEKRIGYSDIDGNGHVNNSRYGDFLIDALNLDMADKEYKNFQIEFVSEAKYGEIMEVYIDSSSDKNRISAVGKVNGNDSFRSQLIY